MYSFICSSVRWHVVVCRLLSFVVKRSMAGCTKLKWRCLWVALGRSRLRWRAASFLLHGADARIWSQFSVHNLISHPNKNVSNFLLRNLRLVRPYFSFFFMIDLFFFTTKSENVVAYKACFLVRLYNTQSDISDISTYKLFIGRYSRQVIQQLVIWYGIWSSQFLGKFVDTCRNFILLFISTFLFKPIDVTYFKNAQNNESDQFKLTPS